MSTAITTDRRRARRAVLLLGTSIALFTMGIFLPSYTVYPSLGSFWADAVVAGFTGQDLTAQTKSIFGTVAGLLAADHPLQKSLGFLLATFSIAFPISKYVCLTIMCFSRREWGVTRWILRWGYFSMVEVYVVAVLAAALIPFLTIRPQIGLVPFFASVVTAYFCHTAVGRHSGAPPKGVCNEGMVPAGSGGRSALPDRRSAIGLRLLEPAQAGGQRADAGD